MFIYLIHDSVVDSCEDPDIRLYLSTVVFGVTSYTVHTLPVMYLAV